MKNVVITILCILILGLSGFIVYDKVINKEEKKDSNVTDNNDQYTLSKEQLNELYDIAGISGIYSESSLISTFINNDGKISDYDKDTKKNIIYFNAAQESKLKYVKGDEYASCASGSGTCQGVSKEDYYEIAKKYNINDKFEDLYEGIYNDIGLYYYGGTVDCGSNVKQEASASYNDGNVVIIDNYVITGNKCTNIDKAGILKFTFNKLEDGTYALYSVQKITETSTNSDLKVDDIPQMQEISLDNELFGKIYTLFNYEDLKQMISLSEPKDVNISDLSDKTILRIALNSMSGTHTVVPDENGNPKSGVVGFKGVKESIRTIFGSSIANRIDFNTVAPKSTPTKYGDFWISKYDKENDVISVEYAPKGGATVGYEIKEIKNLRAEQEGSNIIYLYKSINVYNQVENKTNTYIVRFKYIKENDIYRLDSLKVV